MVPTNLHQMCDYYELQWLKHLISSVVIFLVQQPIHTWKYHCKTVSIERRVSCGLALEPSKKLWTRRGIKVSFFEWVPDNWSFFFKYSHWVNHLIDEKFQVDPTKQRLVFEIYDQNRIVSNPFINYRRNCILFGLFLDQRWLSRDVLCWIQYWYPFWIN